MTEQVSSAGYADVERSPRQELRGHQAETVTRLLQAGLEELRVSGYHELTMRRVATRAGVSPATAYTYLSSKNHLVVELFWQRLVATPVEPAADGVDDRLQAVTRSLAGMLEDEPELAGAATGALLSPDPDVERIRLRVGQELVRRFADALGEDADPRLTETLGYAFSGALLQAGMGLMTYADMARRLDAAVAVILEGHR